MQTRRAKMEHCKKKMLSSMWNEEVLISCLSKCKKGWSLGKSLGVSYKTTCPLNKNTEIDRSLSLGNTSEVYTGHIAH